MKNIEVIKHILSKGFQTVETTGDGVGVFKKMINGRAFYLSLHKDRRMQIMDNKSNVKFDGYPKDKAEFDLVIRMIRI